jgi:uncharacterized protein YdiU (UPF0061 family)
MRAKIGLMTDEDGDLELVNELLSAMEDSGADYTLVFRRLSRVALGDDSAVRALFDDPAAFNVWAGRWRTRLGREDLAPDARAHRMDRVNPIYIPRNHKVEEALAAAVEQEDMTAFSTLLGILDKPFDEVEGREAFTLPAPAGPVPYRTFCGT